MSGFTRFLAIGHKLGLNAHAMNYALISIICVGPFLIYSLARSPTMEQVEHVLDESTPGQQKARIQRNTENINAFWKLKRKASEMDPVFDELLRSGKSNVKRHYELGSGSTLADAEMAQNPKYAKLTQLLALPNPKNNEQEKDIKDAAEALKKTLASPLKTKSVQQTESLENNIPELEDSSKGRRSWFSLW
jgi:hypothetical protein